MEFQTYTFKFFAKYILNIHEKKTKFGVRVSTEFCSHTIGVNTKMAFLNISFSLMEPIVHFKKQITNNRVPGSVSEKFDHHVMLAKLASKLLYQSRKKVFVCFVCVKYQLVSSIFLLYLLYCY